jgi:hypothetical protein
MFSIVGTLAFFERLRGIAVMFRRFWPQPGVIDFFAGVGHVAKRTLGKG